MAGSRTCSPRSRLLASFGQACPAAAGRNGPELIAWALRHWCRLGTRGLSPGPEPKPDDRKAYDRLSVSRTGCQQGRWGEETWLMAVPDRSHALDHIVVVLFENRSLDNVLGHLYGPGDGKDFDGVIGKDLSNPIPGWAEHGTERNVVPYTVATDMDSPNPDSGEEYFHTNTQLYNILSEENRFKLRAEISAPYNAPAPGQAPTMDGFVNDYISTL